MGRGVNFQCQSNRLPPRTAGGKNPIARLSPLTGQGPFFLSFADGGHRRGKTGRLMRNVAPDDRHPMAPGDIGQTAIEVSQPFNLHFLGHGQCDHRCARTPAHGGDITEIAIEELGPDSARGNFVIEVFPVDHRIDRDQLIAGRAGQNRTVVTDSGGRFGRGSAQPTLDLGDQFDLAQGRDGAGTLAGKRGHGARLLGDREDAIFAIKLRCRRGVKRPY